MFWRGNVSISDWDDKAKYIIIDDIDWQYIPFKKQLLTCMGTITVTDKYVKKKTLFNDKHAITLANEMVYFKEESNYWEQRAQTVVLKERLF